MSAACACVPGSVRPCPAVRDADGGRVIGGAEPTLQTTPSPVPIEPASDPSRGGRPGAAPVPRAGPVPDPAGVGARGNRYFLARVAASAAAGRRSEPPVRSGGGHHEPGSPHLRGAGEPLVRSLLRDVPRAPTGSRGARRHAFASACPIPAGPLPAAVPRPELVRQGGPHCRDASAIAWTAGRWTGSSTPLRIIGNCVRKHPDKPPCPQATPGPQAAARRDGIPHRRTRSRTTGRTRAVHAARSDVRADRLVDAARRTCSSCRGGRRPAPTSNDPMSCRPTCRSRAATPPTTQGLEPGARRAAPVRVGRHHVAALPSRA